MSNTTTSIRAILHICHRPLTFRDVTTWDHEPEVKFASKEEFKTWVKELKAGSHFEGGTYLEVWEGDKWFTTKYAYWDRLLVD